MISKCIAAHDFIILVFWVTTKLQIVSFLEKYLMYTFKYFQTGRLIETGRLIGTYFNLGSYGTFNRDFLGQRQTGRLIE